MRKILSLILALLIFTTAFSSVAYGVSDAGRNIVSAKTVTSSAELRYSKKFGANYKNSPTPPVAVKDTLVVASGNYLYKLRAENGSEIAKAEMVGSNMYSIVSPFYADGKIFVLLDGGIIQAFSYDTMESLWVYENPKGGQGLTPITYSYGYIYTGFWNGETERGSYVCISVSPFQKPV